MSQFTDGRGRNILLVEDDPAVAEIVTAALELQAYEVRLAKAAAEARAVLDGTRPHLVILDLLLPDEDGLVLCAELRAYGDIGILVCSGTNRARDRILALRLGADDFLAKPFDVAELEARVHAVLRRIGYAPRAAVAETPSSPGQLASCAPHQGAAPPTQQAAHRPIVLDDLVIVPNKCRATLGSEVLPLTATEYRLLCALAREPATVCSREELAQQVWGSADAAIGRAIDAHIGRLRAKIAAAASSAAAAALRIESVRGFGYQLVPAA